MVAFGTYKTSAAWKLFAKAKDVPFDTSNNVSKQIAAYEKALVHADEDEKENISVYKYIDAKYVDIFEESKKYQSLIASWSIAPCSYLLYGNSIRRQIGLVKVKDNICCAIDGHVAEAYHFLKNDLLKVSVMDLVYRVFERIGEEPFDVNELLRRVENDKATWDIYKSGCTIGINQIEKEGTSARARIYKPSNVSELTAFIAAIRPGFASMYKKFESREPFDYDTKAIDTILQSEEMPYSFCIYQEQVMNMLNFAGIPMAECYSAIKNIAKKRVEKVLAYKETFINGFVNAIINEGKTEDEAKDLADKFWTIVEDNSRYSFNSSHAYCMAIDSLYTAYLKSHYPLEFYEVMLTQQSEKGDKDRMLALKNEAEDYFKISFPPFRYGQDNREIKLNREKNEIVNSLAAIKGFSKSVCGLLYECSKEVGFTSFIDVLRWLDKHSFKSAKIEPLIKIGYFDCFGNEKTLMMILMAWDYLKQGSAKELNKETIPEMILPVIKQMCSDVGVNGKELKSYKVADCDALLSATVKYIYDLKLENYSYKEIMTMQMEILGSFDLTTGKEEDRKKLFVLDIWALNDRFNGGIWKYNVSCKSIGSGKTCVLSLPKYMYEKTPVEKGDIIRVEVAKDKKGYWNIYELEMLK